MIDQRDYLNESALKLSTGSQYAAQLDVPLNEDHYGPIRKAKALISNNTLSWCEMCQ